jgi:glycosyltransferase involved in cell wall biosynthesis
MLPRPEVLRLYEQAHANIITSCKEANTTVLWEAMASGVPTITLDHCGMHDTVCDNCGVRIPIKSYEQIVSGFSDSIDSLFSDPRRLRSLSEGALSCASRYAYANRHAFFNDLYDKAIEHYGRIHDVQFRRQ